MTSHFKSPCRLFVAFSSPALDHCADSAATVELMLPFLHVFLVRDLLQFIFRKIADVKREQERQRTEVSIAIPDDHPVRKLFQKFRQQREAQSPGEPAAHSHHNCVQAESQHHAHRSAASRRQDKSAEGGAAPPPVSAEESERGCRREAGECAEARRGRSPAPGCASEGDGAAARAAGCRGARGWAKFRNAASAAPPPAAVEEEPPQREEEWPKGSRPSKQPEAPEKKQDLEEMESAEGGPRAGDEGAENGAMHKTDSCDSGITVRIDRAGDSRSSFEKSPMEKSPVERSAFDQTLGVDSLKHSLVPPPSEQPLLQALLQQAKLELKGDIQILSGRLSILESQVSEVLRLLSVRRRLSLPPISSPKLRGKSPDLAAGPTPAPAEADEGPLRPLRPL